MKGFHPGKHRCDDYAGRLVVDCDVAIVGAGAGGCAAAAAMAEKGLKVALFEEGRHWRPSEFKQETSFSLRNLYQDRGARSCRGNTVMALPGGRGVGGSTLINSAICFRAPDPILAHWREVDGLHTVTDDRFHGYFDRIYDTIGVTTQSAEIQRLNNTVFKAGAEKLGLNGSFLARNAPGCVGCGICQYGCPTGGKASVDRTFLAEALSTGRVAVHADVKITAAARQGSRITGLSGHVVDGETQEAFGEVVVRADTYVISAGPVGTPVFLLQNDLAPNDHVGRHLVVHPTFGALARYPFEIRPWRGVTQGYYVDRWEEGYLLQTYTVTPDQYFSLLPTAVGEETMRWMADLKYLGSAGALVHDEDSEGRVQLSPVGPDISYFLGDGDRRRLLEGVRMTARVFFAAGATEVLPFRVGAGSITRPEDIEDHLSLDLPATHLQLYASHPMGTARMHGDPTQGVVDPVGRVHGLDNLRIADASVFPSSLGVNPQVTTMAMGLLVGHAIAGEVV